MLWIIFLALLILFELIADVFAKEWSLRGSFLRAFGAIAAYMLANVFWLFALKNGSGLAKGAVIFSVASALVATLLGLLIYREEMDRIQILGIFFGLISIVLIFWRSAG